MHQKQLYLNKGINVRVNYLVFKFMFKIKILKSKKMNMNM